MAIKQNILPLMTLLFLSCTTSGMAAEEASIVRSTKPALSTTNPQLKGKISKDTQINAVCKPNLATQQPKTDATTLPLTGKIKRHALWDVYELTLSKTDEYKRVPSAFLNIQTVFRTIKNKDVDDNTKRFFAFLVKNWTTFTSREDPPPIDLTVLGENIWAISQQRIPLTLRNNADQMPNKVTSHLVDTNEDGMLTREELTNAIKVLDAVPNNLKTLRSDETFNYFRLRATLCLLLESFDMFDAQTNSAEYKYL